MVLQCMKYWAKVGYFFLNTNKIYFQDLHPISSLNSSVNLYLRNRRNKNDIKMLNLCEAMDRNTRDSEFSV